MTRDVLWAGWWDIPATWWVRRRILYNFFRLGRQTPDTAVFSEMVRSVAGLIWDDTQAWSSLSGENGGGLGADGCYRVTTRLSSTGTER